MTAIFLSASVPDPRRNPIYYDTSDVISIRDAVRALATVVLPHATLYWGGHPAITPLIRSVAESTGLVSRNCVRLFQSAWFSDVLPADNAAFEHYELTEKKATLQESLLEMRQVMLSAARFEFGIFIGGMEGVEEEFAMLRERQPWTKVLPIASTGAAAALIYRRERERLSLSADFEEEYAYPSLFRRHLALRKGMD